MSHIAHAITVRDAAIFNPVKYVKYESLCFTRKQPKCTKSKSCIFLNFKSAERIQIIDNNVLHVNACKNNEILDHFAKMSNLQVLVANTV